MVKRLHARVPWQVGIGLSIFVRRRGATDGFIVVLPPATGSHCRRSFRTHPDGLDGSRRRLGRETSKAMRRQLWLIPFGSLSPGSSSAGSNKWMWWRPPHRRTFQVEHGGRRPWTSSAPGCLTSLLATVDPLPGRRHRRQARGAPRNECATISVDHVPATLGRRDSAQRHQGCL